MKNKILLTLLMLVSCFALASCNQCKHEWEEIGVTQAPTCSKEGKREFVCTLCEKEKVEKIPTIEHSYSLSTVRTEEEHYHQCVMCGEKVDSQQHTFTSPNSNGKVECTTCNYIKKNGNTVYFDNLTNSFSQSVKVTLTNLTIEIAGSDWSTEILINDAVAALKYNGEEIYGLVEGKFEVTEGDQESTETFVVEGQIALENEYVYVSGTKSSNPNESDDGNYYLRGNLLSFPGFITENSVNNLLSIQLSEEILNKVEAIVEKIYKAIGTSESDMIEDMLNTFFEKEGNVYTLDLSVVKEFCDLLNTMSIKEVFDHYMGAGSYEQLKNNIVNIITSVRISQLIDMLQNFYGIDINEVIDLIEDIVIELGISNSLTDLLGIDLKAILNDYEFKKQTIFEFLSVETGKDEGEPVDDFITLINKFFDQIGQTEIDLYENVPAIEEIVNSLNNNLVLTFETSLSGVVKNVNIAYNQEFDGDKVNLNLVIEECNGDINTTPVKEAVEAQYALVDFENAVAGDEEEFVYNPETGIIEYLDTYKYSYPSYDEMYEYVTVNTTKGEIDLSIVENYTISVVCGNWIQISIEQEHYVAKTHIQLVVDQEGNSQEDYRSESNGTKSAFTFAYNTETKEIIINPAYDLFEHDYQLQEDGSYKCSKCE